VGASVEEPPSEGAVARLDYRLPRADGSGQDVLTVRQSRPARGLQVFIDPARVVSRADVAGREAVVYRPDGPPSGRGFLILAWTDGERHVELWGTLPAARLVEIARALAP
jgi:hypothetical protein